MTLSPGGDHLSVLSFKSPADAGDAADQHYDPDRPAVECSEHHITCTTFRKKSIGIHHGRYTAQEEQNTPAVRQEKREGTNGGCQYVCSSIRMQPVFLADCIDEGGNTDICNRVDRGNKNSEDSGQAEQG